MRSAKSIAVMRSYLKYHCIQLGMSKEDIAAVDEISTEEGIKALMHFLIDAYRIDITLFEPFYPRTELLEPSKYLAPGEEYNEFEVVD